MWTTDGTVIFNHSSNRLPSVLLCDTLFFSQKNKKIEQDFICIVVLYCTVQYISFAFSANQSSSVVAYYLYTPLQHHRDDQKNTSFIIIVHHHIYDNDDHHHQHPFWVRIRIGTTTYYKLHSSTVLPSIDRRCIFSVSRSVVSNSVFEKQLLKRRPSPATTTLTNGQQQQQQQPPPTKRISI
jgi:hypothetical protein